MVQCLKFEDYTVAWICALKIELSAARFMLDEEHDGNFPSIAGDDNNYIGGQINGHNVAIVSMPKNNAGPVSAATLAAQMRRSFPNLLFGLMVGVGAGCPGKDLEPDIRLGDVVIATPSHDKATPAVVGYDLGREFDTGFEMYGTPLANTSQILRHTFEKISVEVPSSRNSFARFLSVSDEKKEAYEALFSRPNEADNLYSSQTSCTPPEYQLVPRKPRKTNSPVDHYGPIASGSKVIRSAALRDRFRDENGILCFEMEAAGILDIMNVGVIRGICDYADTHKNKTWQPYAAATAAAYAKKVLYTIGADESKNPQPSKAKALRQEAVIKDVAEDIISSLKSKAGNPRLDTISDRYRETYTWIWSSTTDHGPGFREWLSEDTPSVFWISGKPGAGKSTLMKYIYEDEQTSEFLARDTSQPPANIAGYFFHELGRDSEKTVVGFLHSIISQILAHHTKLAQSISRLFERQKAMYSLPTDTIWTKSSLFKALTTLMNQDSVQCTILLIIDGLDECQEDFDEALEFLLELIESSASKKLRLKACMSSRPLATIEDRLQGYPGFRIQDRTAPDISKYVQLEISKSLRLARDTVDQSIIQKIKDDIVDQSMGVFIWVKLVLYEICQGIREGECDEALLKRLKSLPQELEDLYNSIFKKIEQKGHLQKALEYLHILTIHLDGSTPRAWANFHPTLLDLAFVDKEDSIDAPVKVMEQSEQARLCWRMRKRLQARVGSLIEFSPLELHTDFFAYASRFLDIANNSRIRIVHLTLYEYLKSSHTQSSASFQEKLSAALASYMCGYLRMVKSVTFLCPFPSSDPKLVYGMKIENRIRRLSGFLEVARRYEEEAEDTSAAYLHSLDTYFLSKAHDWKLSYLNCKYKEYERLDKFRDRDLKALKSLLALLQWLGISPDINLLLIAMLHHLYKYLKKILQQNPVNNHKPPFLHLAVLFLQQDCRNTDSWDHELIFEREKKILETLFESGCTITHEHRGITAWALSFFSPWRSHFISYNLSEEFLKRGADPNIIIYCLDKHIKTDFFCGRLSWNQAIETATNWYFPMHVFFRDLKRQVNDEIYAATWKSANPSVKLAQLFIEKGANPWLKDSRGETIIDTARKYDPRAAEFILNLYATRTQGNSLLSTPTLPLALPKRKSSTSLATESSAKRLAVDRSDESNSNQETSEGQGQC